MPSAWSDEIGCPKQKEKNIDSVPSGAMVRARSSRQTSLLGSTFSDLEAAVCIILTSIFGRMLVMLNKFWTIFQHFGE
jgi:hypothetical protein